MLPGEHVELAAFVPSGNTAVASAMWPFNTRVKRSRTSAGGSSGPAIQTVRVTSVVPSGYCPPESSRKTLPGSSGRLVSSLTR